MSGNLLNITLPLIFTGLLTTQFSCERLRFGRQWTELEGQYAGECTQNINNTLISTWTDTLLVTVPEERRDRLSVAVNLEKHDAITTEHVSGRNSNKTDIVFERESGDPLTLTFFQDSDRMEYRSVNEFSGSGSVIECTCERL